MCVPCFGNRSTPAPGSAGMLGRHKAHESHDPRRTWKAPRIAELGGNGSSVGERFTRKIRPQVVFDGGQSSGDFVDATHVRAAGMLERR